MDEVIEGKGPLSISTGWSGAPGLVAYTTSGGFYYSPETIEVEYDFSFKPVSWSATIAGVAENDYTVIATLNISKDADPTQKLTRCGPPG